MDEQKRFYITTAIDYPNSRPHIGTAFEKIGADVQARYRRMEGYAVHFLMGNDENTVKVAKRAAELDRAPKEYCDDMANQFKDVWRALDISFDDFIQTSEPRHHAGCQKFIQKVFDSGAIYKGTYEGWYCDGCESFKTDTEAKEAEGLCSIHKTPLVRRSEPCHFFALSRFQERLLAFYEAHPDFIQPECRRNEIVTLVKTELKDVNITRQGQSWGIRVPFDPDFTIWVWFDALLNYITAIGYGSDEKRFKEWWPADVHFIGKDITRFHCALWPAMLLAAGVEPPSMVFGHGFVYFKGEKISKTLGNIVEPMEIITKFSSEAFRYYFMRECPFPGDGDFTWQRFADLYNADLANNLGNLYSRVVTLITKNFAGCLDGTAGKTPPPIHDGLAETVRQVKTHIEACQYNQALEKIWRQVLDPANQYTDRREPWKLVKTDKDAAKETLFGLAESLRVASILIKPFLPRTGETIYRSFHFTKPWESVSYADAASATAQQGDLRILAQLEGGKVKPMFPRIE
ncbi:MAG: methionine--tRNA ligase [Gemmataceae bacterium]|nr:methionine--tRNA ligase [Gemmataceae bacterium]MCI0743449.1 methionine--tRNA ligase [Gemmataceae bacterium]